MTFSYFTSKNCRCGLDQFHQFSKAPSLMLSLGHQNVTMAHRISFKHHLLNSDSFMKMAISLRYIHFINQKFRWRNESFNMIFFLFFRIFSIEIITYRTIYRHKISPFAFLHLARFFINSYRNK